MRGKEDKEEGQKNKECVECYCTDPTRMIKPYPQKPNVFTAKTFHCKVEKLFTFHFFCH